MSRMTRRWQKRVRYLALAGLCMILLPGAMPPCTLTVNVEDMRSDKGILRICLTSDEAKFPDCDNDPHARFMNVPAKSGKADFGAVPKGSYALSIYHDENANFKLDTFAGIPREGIGFSRNPSFTFGPPKFSKALFAAENGANLQKVKIKYFL